MSERKRNAEATRSDIIASAQRSFSRKGYDAASVREIASEVGVNPSLINRYFGGKEKLFYAAIDGHITFEGLLVGSKEEFCENITHHFATKAYDDDLDLTMVIVKSLSSETIGPHLKERIEKVIISEMAEWLDGEDKEQRAALIVAHFVGFDVLRRAVGVSAFAAENLDTTVSVWTDVLKTMVDG